MGIDINDPTPIRLRADDQADQIPMMVIEMAQLLADLFDEAVAARDLQQRTLSSHDERMRQRVRDRLVEHVETASNARSHLETLTRTLRAAGRL
jgi:hypothetical protein